MAVKYSLSKAGLEVYTTEPMTKESDESKKDKNNEKESSDTTEDTQNTASDVTMDSSTNFTLENGETKQIDYVGELLSDSFEMDYSELSSNSSVSVPIKYVNLFFKGKKVALKKALQDGSLKWKDMDTTVIGFVTELTWNKDKVDIKISGMDKLMEVDKQFTFKQTKRSEIIKQIIEASGLKAKVDATGLVDDVIDFTNVSSSGSSDSASAQASGSASIDEAVKKAIAGKTSDLEKAKAIDAAFKSYIIYDFYEDCDYPNDLEAAWKDGHLNCADGANILCAMFLAAGLNAVIIHVPPEYSEGYGHYIVKVTINGKDYYTDNAASSGYHTSRPFGEVFGQPIGDEVGTRISE